MSAGTAVELTAKKPSATGVAAFDVIKVDMTAASVLSVPIYLGGRKVVSLQSNSTITSTNITIKGANFSSGDKSNGVKEGFVVPNDADFADVYDSTDTIVQFTTVTAAKLWALGSAGFPVWIQIELSVAQIATFYIGAKG